MPTTYSPNLRIELIGTGEQANIWGNTTNRNLGTLIEDAIAGLATITMTNVDYTLSVVDGLVDESRQMILLIQGSNSQVRNVICPSVSKVYVVRNATTGGFGITIKTSAGTGVTIPNGKTSFVFCDGANVQVVDSALIDATLYNATIDSLNTPLSVANGGTGANTLAGVRTAIGAAASGVNTDITALLGLTSPIPVNQGGTGGTTPTSARVNLGAAISGVNNDITQITGLTTALSISQGGTAGTTAQAARTNILPSQASANNKFLQSNGTDVSFQDVTINVSAATGTLPIANGGTGATNAPAALVNLNAAGLDAAQTFTKGQRGEITSLVDGVTITPDFSDSNNFTLTLGGNRTLANPTNLVAGQSGSIFVVQDGTGGRTLAYGTSWDFVGGIVPTLTTTANAVDRIDYIVRSGSSIHAVASFNYS
jgi:hypothetical protein